MKINFKQPKYVLPVIILPFLCFFFYVWRSGFMKPDVIVSDREGLNENVGNVSAEVKKKQLADKLDAYRNTYKEANGMTAVSAIPHEQSSDPAYSNHYAQVQQQKLDSIQHAMKRQFSGTSAYEATNRREAVRAVEDLNRKQQLRDPAGPPVAREKDPMEVFREQMAVMDSINKANDPAFKEEEAKRQAADKVMKLQADRPKLIVQKTDDLSDDFNTVLPDHKTGFISAVIDENVTGYAGSRLRLKLLEDIKAGEKLVRSGTYVYAQISGFSEQRVTLTVSSILYNGQILPVKLDIFDLDGLPGLYVPSSAFREFTKDLGGSSVQGVSIDGSSGKNQFIMSSLDKVFQSTSSAIANLIRKNKAKLKYNSYLYLIDPDALQNTQKNY